MSDVEDGFYNSYLYLVTKLIRRILIINGRPAPDVTLKKKSFWPSWRIKSVISRTETFRAFDYSGGMFYLIF